MEASKYVIDCATGETTTEPLTADELAQQEADADAVVGALWDELRAQRNDLLTDSDWTQVQDATANPDDWTAYRQELRDLPQTTEDPAAVEWPEAPLTPGERSAQE